MVGWFKFGRFLGSMGAAFVTTKAKLEREDRMSNVSTDYCPEETKTFISKSLEICRPSSEHLTGWGRKRVKDYLAKNDYFGSLLAIDGNTKSTAKKICIEALKAAAKCICAGYNEDRIRAVTYSYLALRHTGLD